MTRSRMKKLSVLNFCFAVICTLALYTNSYLWQRGIDSYVDKHGIILMIPPTGLMFSALLALTLMLILIYQGLSNRSSENIKLPFIVSLIVFLSVAVPFGVDRYKEHVKTERVTNCIATALATAPATDEKYEATLKNCLSELRNK